MDDVQRRLLSAIARRYYLEDAAKTDLAKEFSMSRFRVARLLQQARETGVVTIEINDLDERRDALSADLAEHLLLDECVVVKAGEDEEDNRRRLARAASLRIKEQVRDGDLLGLSWGRTLAAIGEELADLPPCTIIQLTGTVGNDLRQSPVEVIRRIAGRSSVDAVAIFAPLFAASETAAQTFRSDPAVRGALERYADLSLAVLAVGSWTPPITQLDTLVTEADRAELALEGTLAEVAGIFLREDGSTVDAAVTRRRISVSVDELLATPQVLAVAGSVEKAPAIAATARSGLITSLVTDDRTAGALLALPAVESHALGRRPSSRPHVPARRTS
ncbi:sugar-binding transcriptional regulator [Nocardioides mesophilus]|uniref:Transcriptional regulator n=1 Tax=Nocardioides mesophilus TaxID=433659 RepID=A0A7G9RDB1_9ACTN|nr:sugar-binding domain-containing protein [Nocardioides mesophilus]QNN53586.1 transcriptional regulator [Nocardioides mesophilus]